MKLLVISSNYPSPETPNHGVFVYNLIQTFCKAGHEAMVISPQKWWRKLYKKQYYGEENARVFRPNVFSFSTKQINGFNTYTLTTRQQVNATKKIIKKNQFTYDVVYAHFLLSGFLATEAIGNDNTPIITAIGESSLTKSIDLLKKTYSNKEFEEKLNRINGFVAVSEHLKNDLINHGIDSKKILVAPNATDLSRFRKANKSELRKKHNIPNDTFVLVFTGNFIPRKGPDRVMQAIEGLDNVAVMFIGEGPVEPRGEQIVFKKHVPGTLVPELLNCADAFILPTLNEGANNAIIEAMACGLPIISSNIPEVQSQCDPSFSILVDPMDVQAIRRAVVKLCDDRVLREKMSDNAREWVKRFDLNERAKKILVFLERQNNVKD